MSKKKVVLNFPPHLIDQPITYRLVKDFDLMVNILRARITPNEWGRMVVELIGNGGRLEEGIQCTACIAPCPTHALGLDRSNMKVSFDRELCIACELCLNSCAYRAIEMSLE
jgi:ferredoxin